MTTWLAGPVTTSDELCWVPAQTFTMGSDVHYPEESPAHPVTVNGFRIAPHQVTNAEYAAFVDATGYQTVAERPLDPADFPGAGDAPPTVPPTIQVVRPERTVVRDVNEVLPIALSGAALLIVLMGTAFLLVRVRLERRHAVGRSH